MNTPGQSHSEQIAKDFATLLTNELQPNFGCPEEGMSCYLGRGDWMLFESRFKDGLIELSFRDAAKRQQRVLKLKPVGWEKEALI